jgi:multidrug efflux pump subunit AcrA (membrane-fusion protein)
MRLMEARAGERGIVIVGILPLLAAAVWLVALRDPPAVEAYARAASARAHVERSGLGDAPAYVGVVVAGEEAELGAELGGEVVKVFAEPGARVTRGQPLLQLEASAVVGARNMASAQAVEDRSALAAAQLAFDTARDKADRMASAPSAYAERDLRSARNDAARAAAELQRLRGSASLHRASHQRELARAEKQIIRAPFDGVLAARFVDLGAFVPAGQLVARVVDDTRFVRFALPSGPHARLQVGAKVRALMSGSSLPLMAAVVDVDPELDTAADLGFARARFTSQQELAPGSRVEVYLQEQLR